MAPTTSARPLYARIAESLSEQVRRGTLRPGDRAPSLRRITRQHGVSLSTAILAYRWLESHGELEARPKSGFFVRTPPGQSIPEPERDLRPPGRITPIEHAILDGVIGAVNDPANVPFGAGCMSPELFPNQRLNLLTRRILAARPMLAGQYEMPPGLEALRRQIARYATDSGCRVSPGEITVTSGALEGVRVAVRAVTQRGDLVAVESPTFFGVLEALLSMGLRVVEIPTHPRHGMDLDRLAQAIRQRHVKAVFAMPNCHNPLGFVMSDDAKRALVEITAGRRIPLIEDDLCGDLAFSGERPRTAKSFDRNGFVLLCSSFSKTIAPGLRIGWVAGGRFHRDVTRFKMLASVASPSVAQAVVAEFLESGGYDRHVRRIRARLADQLEQARHGVARYFPEGTRVTRPAGGHMLWVELPPRTDSVRVFHEARAQHVSVLPGLMFSAERRYRNYLRLNCGHVWSETYERGLLTLGRICHDVAGRRGVRARAG